MTLKLTENRRKILQAAADDRRNLGVVERPYLIGFERVSWERNAKAMVGCGWLSPYLHGGFEITAAGRQALQEHPANG
jgi:hypothetical protein